MYQGKLESLAVWFGKNSDESSNCIGQHIPCRKFRGSAKWAWRHLPSAATRRFSLIFVPRQLAIRNFSWRSAIFDSMAVSSQKPSPLIMCRGVFSPFLDHMHPCTTSTAPTLFDWWKPSSRRPQLGLLTSALHFCHRFGLVSRKKAVNGLLLNETAPVFTSVCDFVARSAVRRRRCNGTDFFPHVWTSPKGEIGGAGGFFE